MPRKNTTVSPASLVECIDLRVDDPYLKKLFNKVPKEKLKERIEDIEDPQLKERARKIARAKWVI
jgi:hypothetical protein